MNREAGANPGPSMNDSRCHSQGKRAVLMAALLICVLVVIHVGIIIRFVPSHPAISGIVMLCVVTLMVAGHIGALGRALALAGIRIHR